MKKTLALLLALVLSLSCAGMLFASAEEELPEGALEFQLSHVNLYSWGTYFDMVTYGEGRNCHNLGNGDYGCEWWIALKVDNVDGVYTVTQIEGNGDAKEMGASADGFIMYLYSGNTNCPENFAAAQQVEVGYTVYSHTFDWTSDAASETALGNIVLVPAAADEGGDEPAPEEPGFDFVKKITAVEGTAVDDNTDEVALDGQIYYFPGNADSERVILSDDYNFRYSYIMICNAEGTIVEVGNNLVFKSVNDKDFQNEITIPAGGYAFTFFYNADAAPSNEDLLAVYTDALTQGWPVTEVYNETVTLASCSHKLKLEGDYIVVNNGTVPSDEPSEAPSEDESTTPPPQTGDAGILVFALMAVVAIAGCATAVKARG